MIWGLGKKYCIKVIWTSGIVMWILLFLRFSQAQFETIVIEPHGENRCESRYENISTDSENKTSSSRSSNRNSTKTNAEVPLLRTSQNCSTDTVPKKKSVKECININKADLETLITLPGIGPVLAQRILEYRNIHGEFTDNSQLVKIKGIGPKKLEKIRDLICF